MNKNHDPKTGKFANKKKRQPKVSKPKLNFAPPHMGIVESFTEAQLKKNVTEKRDEYIAGKESFVNEIGLPVDSSIIYSPKEEDWFYPKGSREYIAGLEAEIKYLLDEQKNRKRKHRYREALIVLLCGVAFALFELLVKH